MMDGNLFCGDCYAEQYGATCNGCGQKIGGDELWIEALDATWHQRCFICEVSIGTGPYAGIVSRVVKDQAYCGHKRFT